MSEGNGHNWSPDIKDLGDKIVALTLSKAVELGDYMEKVHKHQAGRGRRRRRRSRLRRGGGRGAGRQDRVHRAARRPGRHHQEDLRDQGGPRDHRLRPGRRQGHGRRPPPRRSRRTSAKTRPRRSRRSSRMPARRCRSSKRRWHRTGFQPVGRPLDRLKTGPGDEPKGPGRNFPWHFSCLCGEITELALRTMELRRGDGREVGTRTPPSRNRQAVPLFTRWNAQRATSQTALSPPGRSGTPGPGLVPGCVRAPDLAPSGTRGRNDRNRTSALIPGRQHEAAPDRSAP